MTPMVRDEHLDIPAKTFTGSTSRPISPIAYLQMNHAHQKDYRAGVWYRRIPSSITNVNSDHLSDPTTPSMAEFTTTFKPYY
ncbi:hypothetical protein BO94DRAFT_215891 [Aspergillus sclerotioniger CBS 115572]|uniref:Uncharacterized protein n=1 Tax=Aspergillus sclerotioniger CBS 115572 TaxID=1450535 RepID=A0A317X9H0_9EURO|nr:hypothetical protein BO94DRAFT_215891 [Aspergillus sclerotioniger CBS 115572]PWY95005.1 hypothetical protein BO94DRAFT_215891 [Aspergillus sclerotioniger CBS 115572]